MRVALISPYSAIEATGLRILSACLKRAGFTTRMIFLPDVHEAMAGAHYDERNIAVAAMSRIVELCADTELVGITVMTPSFFVARQLTQALHSSLKTPVIWGGIHPTVRPDECLRFADMVCIGEGEQTIVELAQRIAEGRDYGDINNLARLDCEGNSVINPLYPLGFDLDRLPFPDYEFNQHYVLHHGQVFPFSQNLMHYYLTDLGRWARGPVYRVLTTRGCPYRCSYCANNALANIYPDWCKLRRRSPVNVIAEIQSVRARLPSIEAIVIDDDTFLANPEPYIAEFCQCYSREVGLPFRVYTTAQTADPIKLDLLANAGLRFIVMGIQTGSVRIQKLYQRNVSNDRLLRAARIIHTFQAWVPRPMYDIITDNPYETDDDRFETLQLIHRLPQPYRLSLFSLTFYPGTELYRQAKADGLAQNEIEDIYGRNFLMVEANFYNLALYCHHLNLPWPFLFLITRRIVFDFLSREPMNLICGRLFQALMQLRLYTNKRLYSQRQLEWSEQDLALNHDRNSRL